jgi:hypothetical protein
VRFAVADLDGRLHVYVPADSRWDFFFWDYTIRHSAPYLSMEGMSTSLDPEAGAWA